jgi:hypothetical protein
MKVYQLKAHGSNKALDGPGYLYSKRLFPWKCEALAYEPKFRVKCTTELSPADLACLVDNDFLTFSVVELEISLWS